MANYTAADVKRLRELTGAGMLDCKNALAETDGDFDKAVEVLRIKGAKDVGKRAERATADACDQGDPAGGQPAIQEQGFEVDPGGGHEGKETQQRKRPASSAGLPEKPMPGGDGWQALHAWCTGILLHEAQQRECCKQADAQNEEGS